MSSKKMHNDGTGPERRPEKYDEQEADSTTATTGQASHDEDALAQLEAQLAELNDEDFDEDIEDVADEDLLT